MHRPDRVIVACSRIASAVLSCTCAFAWGQVLAADPVSEMREARDSDEPTNVIQQLDQQLDFLRSVKFARLVVDVPYSESPFLLTESDLKKRGCSYSTQDVKLIANIVHILKTANITANAHGTNAWSVRDGVYLTLRNGTEIKLLLAQYYRNRDVVVGSLNGVTVTANSSLPKDLFQWAASVGIHTQCDHFISQPWFMQP